MSLATMGTQSELRAAFDELDALTRTPGKLSSDQQNRSKFLLAKISALKAGSLSTDEEIRARAVSAAQEVGVLSARESLRSYLRTGELRTYAGMSVATDALGGYFVPQDFYSTVTAALKQADGLWNDDVVTVVESDHGNVQTFALYDDTAVAASIVSENTSPNEQEITTIDRLLLGKVPTWKSGRMYATLELLQDSQFPVEEAVITPAVASRFQRGVGTANVSTLISSTTSGATSAAPTAISLDDTLTLMQSVDPAYLASPKCFWGMNNNTLISLLRLKDAQGRYLWKPRSDANGRLLLWEKPIVLMPSLPNAIANAEGTVVLGDFSRAVRRVVKNSMRIMRYEQTVGLAEAGIVGYQAFLRTSFGLLASSSSDSPIKYLTQHA
ncbi:MAG: phage major capsid protein family [Candidatus Acidoferrum typicum]|nr:phage major capsid protein family [Candidatus Acidoferrum typicum]